MQKVPILVLVLRTKPRKPMTLREITDSAEIDGLRRQLESARRTEAFSKKYKRTRPPLAASEVSSSSGETPSDLGQLQRAG